MACQGKGDPATNSPAPVLLEIRPLRNAQFSEVVEITLTSASAQKYELVGGPVQAVTPGPGQTNLLWVNVLARGGVNPTGNNDQAIHPPLAFQAQLKARGAEVISYGNPTVLSSSALKAVLTLAPRKPAQSAR